MQFNKYNLEIELTEKIVKEGFELLKNTINPEINVKGVRDLVTATDTKMEQMIISRIKDSFPNDTILSEEYHPDVDINGRTWVIDPIDGTCNYANHIPMYGIQIALVEQNETVVSCIGLPCLDEIYLAVKGEGCYLNGQRIKVKAKPIDKAIVSFGDFNYLKPHESDIESQVMKNARFKIMKEKMFGAASVDLVYCASGRTDGTYLIASHLWDILPGVLIAKEAGCLAVDINGEDYQLNSTYAIVANSEELIATLLVCGK